MPISILNPKELRRYRNQIAMPEIGISGQEKLKNASVLVVGSGGLGTPVLQYLVAAGVGIIGISDFDKVEEHNIHRQVIFGIKDVGKHKTVVAKKKLESLNNLVDIKIYNLELHEDEMSIRIMDKYDIIVDATDNYPTRYLLNDYCVKRNKALVHGAVYRNQGQVSTFIFNGAPSYRCLYDRMPDEKRLLKAENFGLWGTSAGIIGTIMAHEIIKLVTHTGELLSGKLLIFDASVMESRIICFDRNPDNFL